MSFVGGDSFSGRTLFTASSTITKADLPAEETLNYYARRWAIEVYFRNAKQLLALGQGQSECFDALIAWTSIVMIRHILLVYILSRKQGLAGSVGPLFQQLAQQHLELAVLPVLIERIRQLSMMSRQLIPHGPDAENFLYLIDLIDCTTCHRH